MTAAPETALARPEAPSATTQAGGLSSPEAAWALLAALALPVLAFAFWLQRSALSRLGSAFGSLRYATGFGPALAGSAAGTSAGHEAGPGGFEYASDEDLVWSIVILHRLAAIGSEAGVNKWLDAHATAISVALERFAPVGPAQAAVSEFRALADGAAETEALRERLDAVSDGDLIYAVLTLQRLAEAEADGQSLEALAEEAQSVGMMLERFAPDALDEGLAAYFGERQPDVGAEGTAQTE